MLRRDLLKFGIIGLFNPIKTGLLELKIWKQNEPLKNCPQCKTFGKYISHEVTTSITEIYEPDCNIYDCFMIGHVRQIGTHYRYLQFPIENSLYLTFETGIIQYKAFNIGCKGIQGKTIEEQQKYVVDETDKYYKSINKEHLTLLTEYIEDSDSLQNLKDIKINSINWKLSSITYIGIVSHGSKGDGGSPHLFAKQDRPKVGIGSTPIASAHP